MKRSVTLNSLVIAIALLLILVIFIGEAIRSRHELSLQTFDKGLTISSFSLPELFDSKKYMTENDLKGRVCLLNFWASWCVACHKEHNTLLLISTKYHIPIFGINFKDETDKAKAFLTEHGNPYGMIGVDAFGRVATSFEVFGIPITYIIDKQGRTRYRYLGVLTISTWEKEIQPLIANLEKETNS